MSREQSRINRLSLAAPLVAALLAGCVQPFNRAPVFQGTQPRAPAAPVARPAPPPTQPHAAAPTAQQPQVGTVLVRPGETIFEIARRHEVDLRDLIEHNRLKPPYRLLPGQRLALPLGQFHRVVEGDTLYGISRQYGVDMRALVQLNRIRPPYRIAAGQKLRLPAADPPPPESRRVVSAGSGYPAHRGITVPPVISRAASRAALANPPPRAARQFLWPVRGRIAIGFGPRGRGLHNDGINILARRGTPVRAAENGIVAYSGNELRGFGNLLLIRHAGGWTSAYAHNDVLLVRAGERVRRGQTISRVGNSGDVRRPQLHFELRRGKRAVNPVRFLTRRTSVGSLSPASFRDGQRDPG